MVISSLILLLTINSIDLGLRFGPNFPVGNLERVYQVTTVASFFCGIKNLEIDYSFSKFTGRDNNKNLLYLNSGTIAYQYPFYQKKTRLFNAIIGTSYNRIKRKLGTAHEGTYAIGLKYGVGYKESLGRFKLVSGVYLSQIVQSRNWQSLQLSSSNFLLSLTTGVSIEFPVFKVPTKIIQKEPSPPPQLPEGEKPVEEITPKLKFENIYFDLDKTEIRTNDEARLNIITRYLKDNPTIKLIIEGHCCPLGTAEYNILLAWRRANSVRNYLIKQGISKDRLIVVSYGSELPETKDLKEYHKNRRCEFNLIE